MQSKENNQSPDNLISGYLKGELTEDETRRAYQLDKTE